MVKEFKTFLKKIKMARQSKTTELDKWMFTTIVLAVTNT